MNPQDYELIEHTADFGIRVAAPDVERLFVKTGLAISGIMARKISAEQSSAKHFLIELASENREELLVAWLNEILSLSASERVIVSAIEIERLDATSLRARISGSDARRYHIEKEIKAATYHGLKLEQYPGGWRAEVIFDV